MTSVELRSRWFLLIPIVAIIYTVWVILLALGKTLGYARAYEPFGFDQWLYLGSALFIILIVITIMWMPPPKKEAIEEEATVAEERAPVIIEAEPLPAQELEKNIIAYPKEVEGAIYSDTFIELDERTVLKLRSFIGRSCLLCPNRYECLEEYKEKISFQDFISSIDCFKVKLKG
ncbi:MAG: hypothetical protein QME47_00110 [Candidatus Thermoplasmatota archaeon]|nr:hypothetical protein [Candidatus Thermoplasmatota archaeon]